MTSFLFYDAAYPPPAGEQPITDGVCIYAAGDTPHPWTVAEIARQTARYRLPIYVRSNPTDATADAQVMIAWLRANKVPVGTTIVLDLETAIYPAYVATFGVLLHAAGYLVLPYGSLDTLFQNPALDGYFVANPTGFAHVVGGTVATQYAGEGSYDLDDVLSSVRLWDTQPAAPATVQPPLPPIRLQPITKEEILMQVTIATDAKGYGWDDVAIPAGYAINGAPSILVGEPGVAPANFEGERYDLASAAYSVGAAAGKVRVTVRMGQASISYGVTVPIIKAA